MKKLALLVLTLLTSQIFAQEEMQPEDGLKRLMAGNKRFVMEKLHHPNRGAERRLEVSDSQSPFAVIITCSDSRVVPEVIFDEGLGDLFVIRVAGNVIGMTEFESVMFAIDHLHPVVVVVMGHENCGAVNAVIEGNTRDIRAIASYINPAFMQVKKNRKKWMCESHGDLLEQTIKMNAIRMKEKLQRTKGVRKALRENRIQLFAAYYDLDQGTVEILEPPELSRPK
ncbi:MAG: Carbonic anhydrase [Chlamydiia bacterium]|nr:Carbonic anhydrase [Chlamydiia bacterium]